MESSSSALYTGMYELPYQPLTRTGDGRSPMEMLRDSVDAHARAESESLAQYRYLAEVAGDPAISLVMQLVLEDEERHHGLLQRIEATLTDALNWTHSPDALPKCPPDAPPDPELASIARELIEEERTGARILRDLADKQRVLADGLPSLLVGMMAMDSQKHAFLLEYVQQRLERRSARS